MSNWRYLVVGVVAASVLFACSDGDDVDAESPPEQSTPAAPTASGGEGEAGEGVPDACDLLTPAELSSLVGAEVGEGTSQSASPDRSICLFTDTGLILAIEVGGNYEVSRQLIDDEGRATEDLTGIGTAAFYDPAGQVVALGEQYFVGVSGGGDIETQKQVAARMLAAAGDG